MRKSLFFLLCTILISSYSFAETPIYILYNGPINLASIGQNYDYVGGVLHYLNIFDVDPSGSENKIGNIPQRVHRMYSGLKSSLNCITTSGIGSNIEVTEFKITYSGPAYNQTVRIKIGTTTFSGGSEAWSGIGGTTYPISKAVCGSGEISLSSSELSTVTGWVKNGTTIYLGATIDNEQNDNAYFTITNVVVRYKKQFDVVVTVDRDYDEESVVSLNDIPVIGMGDTKKFDENSTVNIFCSQQANYSGGLYVFSTMSLSGQTISSTSHSFQITMNKTLHLTYVAARNITLDNRANYTNQPSERIEGSTITIKKDGGFYSTATAGQTKPLPFNANMGFTTNYGSFGLDLNYKQQGIKIRHRDWNENLADFKLEYNHMIDNTYTFAAWYRELFPATVNLSLEGSPRTDAGVKFKDPWKVVDGAQPRAWDSYSVPFTPGTGSFVSYGGLFLNVDYFLNLPNNAHYSIKAEPLSISGIQSYLCDWSATGAQIYSPTSVETPVKFTSSGATVTANYKGLHISNLASSLGSNSQRKYVRTTSDYFPNGVLHLVYESMGKAWYETSTDNGSTWQLENNYLPLSSNSAKNPTITPIAANMVCIAFQEDNRIVVLTYDVYYHTISTGPYYIDDATGYSYNSNPVIVATDAISGYRHVLMFFTVQQGSAQHLCYSHGTIPQNDWSMPITWDQTTWQGSTVKFFFHPQPTQTDNALNPALGYGINGSTIIYQLAFQKNDAIYYERIIYAGGSHTFQTVTELSSGSGYETNTKPSIIGLSDSSARVCWLGYRSGEGGEMLAKGAASEGGEEYRLVFRDPGSGDFWALGQNAACPTITLRSSPAGYVLAWSQSNGTYNKYTAGGPGATIHTYSYGVGTPGIDFQVNNGSSYSEMYAMALRQASSPYAFIKSTSGSLPKEDSHNPLCTGREAVVHDGQTQIFFAFGDITVDGKVIGFKDVPEKLRINSKDDLNKWLTCKSFDVNDQSDVSYRVEYGALNSFAESELFADGDQVIFAVQLVDDKTEQVIGIFDNVIYSKDQCTNVNNLEYKINTMGIGNRTVRIRLVVSAGSNALVSFTTRSTDSENGALGKSTGSNVKQIGYRGTLEIKDFRLAQNYPNPFNPETFIDYDVKDVYHIRLVVYDVLGREIATLVNSNMQQGRYTARWDGRGATSGVYVYRLTATDQSGKNIFTKSQRMMLMK